MASRKTSKELKALAQLAYERELSRCMDALQQEMERWKSGQISVWDIEQSIHEFHNKTARDLYRRYAHTDSVLAVACGIAGGNVTIDDVPGEAREEVQKIVAAINR
jgi:hypothetical protein